MQVMRVLEPIEPSSNPLVERHEYIEARADHLGWLAVVIEVVLFVEVVVVEIVVADDVCRVSLLGLRLDWEASTMSSAVPSWPIPDPVSCAGAGSWRSG